MVKMRKILCVVLSFVLVFGLAGTVQAADDSGIKTELLLHYLFENGGEDSSGSHNDAVIGQGVTVKDGVASLPGGNKDSSAYITLPKGVFDKQDELTIAMWLKDEDPQTSWLGAFFFGSPANANNVPENYYYFVPCEKNSNTLKSVITDSVNATAPNQTEKGIAKSVNTSAFRNQWTHYAITLKPGSMTCYINGTAVGTEQLSRKVSDFGTGLESYIGKSNYINDPIYKGAFKDFRVYKGVLTDQEIQTVMKENMGDIPVESNAYSMKIDADHVTKQLSDNLYGLFYEDINSAADGGLYPEMVKNYSFENSYVERGDTNSDYFKKNGYQTIGHYKLHWDVSPANSFEVKDQDGLNENNTHYAAIKGNAQIKNGGFAPQSDPNGAAMPVKPFDEAKKTGTYTFSAYVKADSTYKGTMNVKLVDAAGKQITDEQEIKLNPDGTWKKISAELKSNVSANTKGKMELSIQGAGADDVLNLDMVSVVPHDSYGYGDKNYAYGVGLRKDLIDTMMDLNPKFLRFPGGCIVEGFNWEGLYDWRDTVGPLEERKNNTNRWENWNNKNRTWGYMQSFGFGYHELLSLCEDYGIEAFPIMSAGVLCQYETANVQAKTGEELQRFIDMATNLLDYCWGDPKDSKWAAKRAENGHEEPFDLKYLGIGNENFQAKYFDNFDRIKNAVEAYKAEHYPDRELNIISSAGPTSDGNNLEYAYDRIAQTMPGETLVDEHYYQSESFMYNQSDRYDYYQRTDQGGSDVFVGEYAVKNNNRYNTALAEAAFITGLERNADVVTNISYAPLLYKVGSLNWEHDLIYFDEFNVAKSTNYYVQQMFGQNYGTELIGTKLKGEGKDYSNSGSPILGMDSSEGYIDKVTVYNEKNEVLLEDDFDNNANGWQRFDSSIDTVGSDIDYEIKDGRLYFKGTNGVNLLYLPKAVEEKWTDYKVVVEGAVKTSGNNGFLIGAGDEEQYYWYNMGKSGNNGVYMEVTRPNRKESSLTRKVLGNNYANKHYQTDKRTKIQSNDEMDITFNFGVNGKLEGSYTSKAVSSDATKKYNFSSDLNEYQTDIYQVVNKDDENVYIKLVNPDVTVKTIDLEFANLTVADDKPVVATMLTGGLNEANAIGNEKVAPKTSELTITDDKLTYELPGYSVNVIRIPLKEKKPETTPVEDIFEDIEADNWFTEYVQYVFDKGIMKGLNEKQFGPDVILSRAQFATILYRMEKEPKTEYENRFPDVPDEMFYTDAVMWASGKDVGVISGYEDQTFGPGDNITREQMAVMMYRYAKYKDYNVSAASDLKDFADRGNVSKFAETEMKWAVGAGLIKGDNGLLNPQGTTSRAVCATIIQRFMIGTAGE